MTRRVNHGVRPIEVYSILREHNFEMTEPDLIKAEQAFGALQNLFTPDIEPVPAYIITSEDASQLRLFIDKGDQEDRFTPGLLTRKALLIDTSTPEGKKVQEAVEAWMIADDTIQYRPTVRGGYFKRLNGPQNTSQDGPQAD